MKSLLALLAAVTVTSAVVPPANAAVYVYRGHSYAYRYHGGYYRYRYHSRYYNHRHCYWNGRAHACRYY
jgi:hypothetical protein